MFGKSKEALALAGEAKRLAEQADRRAETADQRREAHERICTERWEQLRASIEKMFDAMERKHSENRLALGRLFYLILVGVAALAINFAFHYFDKLGH